MYCPKCGTLRAIHQLLHGHITAAFNLNPLTIIILPFIAYALISYCTESILKKPLPKIFIPATAIWLILTTIIAFGICRNIPIHPLTLLAPQ